MNSVGIDLHRKRSHIAALDESGAQLLSRRIVNDPQTFLALLEGVGECRIALEATYGWEWLADVLQDAGYELHLAHPARTKAIASARVKTDAVDARTLAQLLRADLLPEAYIAPRELRDLRDLLRHRVALTRMRSALKNRVSAVLAKNGIQRPYSDLFGPAGLRFLAELELRESGPCQSGFRRFHPRPGRPVLLHRDDEKQQPGIGAPTTSLASALTRPHAWRYRYGQRR
jgi:transposase